MAATAWRTGGSVRAGTFIFRPASLDGQEPSGDQTQSLVVLPAEPVADFVVGQTGFALRALEALLDAMLRLRGAAERLERCLRIGVAEVVIGLHGPLVAVLITDHHEHFFGRLCRAKLTGLDVSSDRLDHDRTLLSIAHIDASPLGLRTLIRPRVDTL